MSEASYKTIYEGGTGEYEEKKSRFIAQIAPTHSEEEAMAFVASVKKKHYDARHNCFAYIIGSHSERMRASDDGEPQGTAGRPMLDILSGNGLTDVVAVVTRYFGGTLLGTGGLVRSYSQAMQDGLAHCRIIEKQNGTRMLIETDYSTFGKLQYYFEQQHLHILDTDYGANVCFETILPDTKKSAVIQDLTEMSGGKIGIEPLEELFYAELDGEIIS